MEPRTCVIRGVVLKQRNLFYLLRNLSNVYLSLRDRETERQNVSRGGAEREGGRQNPKQAPGSELSAQSLTQGLNPRTVGS